MKTISIQPIPLQEFTVNIGDYRYDIRLFLTDDDVMAYDILIDESPVCEGFRVTPGEFLLPYRYQEADGNFLLSVPEVDEPDYNQFGDTQILYYFSAGEMEEVRSGD